MLLFYCLPLLFKVSQGCGSCYCYIVCHYCLRIDRGLVHVGVGYIVYQYCLRFDRGMVHVLVGYIVYHYCLRLDRGVVHGGVVLLSTITV